MLDDFPQESRDDQKPQQPTVAMLDDFVSEADLPPRYTEVQPRRPDVAVGAPVNSPPPNAATPPNVAAPPNAAAPPKAAAKPAQKAKAVAKPAATQDIWQTPSLRHDATRTAGRRPDGKLVAAAVLGLMFGSIVALRVSHFVVAESLAPPSAPAAAVFDETSAQRTPLALPSESQTTSAPSTASPSSAIANPDDGAPPTTAEASVVRPEAAKPVVTPAPSQNPTPAAPEEPSPAQRAAASSPASSPLVLEPLRDAVPAAVAELSPPPTAVSPSTSVATEPPPVPAPPKTEARLEAAAAAAPPPAPPSPAMPAVVDERPAIDGVIDRYRAAYSGLNARAVKQVWPAASETALTRAFANLESQNLAFSQCETTVAGATARAACDGQVSFVGRVGPRQARTENREWTFTLKKTEAGWEIERVQIR